MQRVLVPLDGTELSASILSDARRLAGTEGELILIRHAGGPGHDDEERRTSVETAESYLEGIKRALQRQGVHASTQVYVTGSPFLAIHEALSQFRPDTVACATHARFGLGHFLHDSVAWHLLQHSEIPVMVCHAQSVDWNRKLSESSLERRILVPLDGSRLAESVIPIANQLAEAWEATICLARIVPRHPRELGLAPGRWSTRGDDTRQEVDEAQAYLGEIARTLPGEVFQSVAVGEPADMLSNIASDWWITEIVMATHGRTGLDRMTVGSVADALIHRLYCPLVVIPYLAAARSMADGRVAVLAA